MWLLCLAVGCVVRCHTPILCWGSMLGGSVGGRGGRVGEQPPAVLVDMLDDFSRKQVTRARALVCVCLCVCENWNHLGLGIV